MTRDGGADMDFFDTLNEWMGDVGTDFAQAFGATDTATPFEGLAEEAPAIAEAPLQEIAQTEVEIPQFQKEVLKVEKQRGRPAKNRI